MEGLLYNRAYNCSFEKKNEIIIVKVQVFQIQFDLFICKFNLKQLSRYLLKFVCAFS